MTRYTPQWLQAGSYAASVDRRLLGALWPAPASSGCQVTASSGMGVQVSPGQVAVPTQNNTGTTLCTSDAMEQLTLQAAPPSGQNRYDIIVCAPRGNDLDGGSNTDFVFQAWAGAPASSPTVPTAPAGTVGLATVYIPGASASINPVNITDIRPFGLSLAGGSQALPPAVGSGSALVSFIDASGEMWVAKGGVNAGAWKKARDVLHSRVYRAAAYTFTATGATMVWDTATRDPYSLISLASGIMTAPIAGVYLMSGSVAYTATAAGNNCYGRLMLNGANYAYIGSVIANAAAGVRIPFATASIYCAAGDAVGLTYTSAVGGNLAGIAGPDTAFFNIDYAGTG